MAMPPTFWWTFLILNLRKKCRESVKKRIIGKFSSTIGNNGMEKMGYFCDGSRNRI